MIDWKIVSREKQMFQGFSFQKLRLHEAGNQNLIVACSEPKRNCKCLQNLKGLYQ